MTNNQPETPNDRLNQLETALGRLAELTFQNQYQHGERLNRLEDAMSNLATQQYQHGERLNRLEDAMSNLATQQQQLSTTLVEVLRITAAQNTAIANNNRRIEQILEYLFRERPNGRDEGT